MSRRSRAPRSRRAAPSPLDGLLAQDAGRVLLTALKTLPEECRELWTRILRGASYGEMSRELGVAEGALRVRAHRCRKRAQEALAGNAPPARAAQG